MITELTLATADSSALKRLKATRKSLTAPSLLLCSSCSQVLEALDTCRSLVCCRERWITFFLLPSGSWEMCFFHLLPLGSGVLDTALARRLDFQANTGNRFFKVENNSLELTRIFKESFKDQRWAWETDWWWRWRRNVSFSLSASLSLFSALTLFSHAHLWSLKLSLGNRFASSCKMSVKREGPPGCAWTSSAQFTTLGYPPPPFFCWDHKMKVCSYQADSFLHST